MKNGKNNQFHDRVNNVSNSGVDSGANDSGNPNCLQLIKGDQAVIKTTGFKTAAMVNARNPKLDRAFWAQAGEWVPVVYTGADKHNLIRQIRSEVVNREGVEERRLMTEFKRRNRAINPELHANYGGYTTASQ